jgi:Rps23 Pro-64 3,4-dihydroxylase Tpa1-like proline 4-hydroxylase
MIIQSDKMIKATNLYAGCVAEFENIWPNHKEVIETIEDELVKEDSPLNTHWRRATVGQNRVSDIRTNTVFFLAHLSGVDKTCNELNNRFFTDAYAAVTWYRDYFGIEEQIHEHEKEELSLLRYQTGQKYDAHYDGGTITGRSVSPILYINDDYEGGELEFVHHGVTIKPKAGSLYLFPANYAYAHIAHPVTKGTKYAMVTFFHDREV